MTSKTKIKMSQQEKFKIIDSDLRSFYEYCKEVGMTQEEMDIVCRPLTNITRRSYFRKCARIMFLIMVFVICYLLTRTEKFHWNVSAVGRIVLVSILPYWDWTPLYYNKCLIEKSLPQDLDNSVIFSYNCISCEAVKRVDRLTQTNHDEVFNNHLLRGAPVIVTDVYKDWPISRADINLTLLISQDERLQSSVPCRLLTNVIHGRQPMDLEEIVSRITNTNIPSWFVYFQNCDIKAVKAFRVFAPRPYFLSPHVPPSHFNWLLMAHNYETDNYKYLELDVGLILMSQVIGNNVVKLTPKSPCENECITLEFVLNEGETLVMSSALWDFEYYPGNFGESLALVTETDWTEA